MTTDSADVERLIARLGKRCAYYNPLRPCCDDCGCKVDDDAIAAIRAMSERIAGQQAQIDRLMLEHCPNEMTPEQIEEWGNHQEGVTPQAQGASIPQGHGTGSEDAGGSTPTLINAVREAWHNSPSLGHGFDTFRAGWEAALAHAQQSPAVPADDLVRRLRDALSGLLAAVDADVRVKRGDYYYERQAARAALAALPQERPHD